MSIKHTKSSGAVQPQHQRDQPHDRSRIPIRAVRSNHRLLSDRNPKPRLVRFNGKQNTEGIPRRRPAPASVFRALLERARSARVCGATRRILPKAVAKHTLCSKAMRLDLQAYNKSCSPACGGDLVWAGRCPAHASLLMIVG